MLFLSIILILLGVLIFVYSIIVDAKQRTRDIESAAARFKKSPPSTGTPSRAGQAAGTLKQGRGAPEGKNNDYSSEAVTVPKRKTPAVENDSGKTSTFDKKTFAPAKQTAVLYDDSSHAIDYDNEAGVNDSGLEGYNSIKRIGSGELAVEKGGISFLTGRKLFRYDFHRIRDIKTGDKHLALFLRGSEAVKLFIFDAGSERIAETRAAFKDYLRSSEYNV